MLLTYTAVWRIQMYLLGYFGRVSSCSYRAPQSSSDFLKTYSLSPSLKIKRQYIYNRTLLTTGKNLT